MTGTRQWNTGIAARGRIYFAADNKVYAFTLPTATPTPTPTATATVTPTATPTPVQITLTGRGYKVHGRPRVDLAWSGATSINVDIYRNGTRIVTVPNNGAYTDSPGGRGHATYTYRVCNAGTQTCSNQATVTF
jgi:serine protease